MNFPTFCFLANNESMMLTIFLRLYLGMYVGAGAFLFFKITGGMQEIMPNLPGVVRLVGGLVFPWGLVLVIVTGTELFTGNTSTMVIGGILSGF